MVAESAAFVVSTEEATQLKAGNDFLDEGLHRLRVVDEGDDEVGHDQLAYGEALETRLGRARVGAQTGRAGPACGPALSMA